MEHLQQLHEWLCSHPYGNHLIGFFVSFVVTYYLAKYVIHKLDEYEHKRVEKKSRVRND